MYLDWICTSLSIPTTPRTHPSYLSQLSVFLCLFVYLFTYPLNLISDIYVCIGVGPSTRESGTNNGHTPKEKRLYLLQNLLRLPVAPQLRVSPQKHLP